MLLHPVPAVGCFCVVPLWPDQQLLLAQILEQTIPAELDSLGLKVLFQQVIQLTGAESRKSLSNLTNEILYRLQLNLALFSTLKALIDTLARDSKECAALAQAYFAFRLLSERSLDKYFFRRPAP